LARVAWAHMCDHAFYDAQGKPCLIGIFVAIFTPRVPATHPRCAFAFRIEGSPGEKLKMKFVLVRPDAKDPLVESPEREIDLGPGGHHNAVVELAQLPLPDFGEYEFRIYIDGKAVHELPFQVVRTQVQPAQ